MTIEMNEQPEMIGTVKTDYYRAYFGKDSDYYLPVMIDFEDGKRFNFNVWAFFCGMTWLFYRRLYSFMFIIFCIVIILTIIEKTITDYLNLNKDLIALLNVFNAVIYAIIFGKTGNYFLMRRAQRKTIQILTTYKDEDVVLKKLSKTGSANKFVLNLLFFLNICVIVSYFIRI